MLRQGERLLAFESVADRQFDKGITIKSLKARCPQGETGGYLLVVTAVGEGGPVVAFQDGDSLAEVIVGFINRLENGSVKWKEDQFE